MSCEERTIDLAGRTPEEAFAELGASEVARWHEETRECEPHGRYEFFLCFLRLPDGLWHLGSVWLGDRARELRLSGDALRAPTGRDAVLRWRLRCERRNVAAVRKLLAEAEPGSPREAICREWLPQHEARLAELLQIDNARN
jgi:hypothetical protein